MKLLITIRGNACSGKTTLAGVLQKHFGHGTMCIAQDLVRRKILHVRDEPDPKSIPLLKILLEYGHANTDIVILEGIFKADWYHELFSFANELYEGNLLSYYYDLPFEETRRRRDTKPDRDLLNDWKLHLWWTEKDYAPEWKEVILDEKVQTSEIADEIIRLVEEKQKTSQSLPSFLKSGL